jgi:copper chaperone
MLMAMETTATIKVRGMTCGGCTASLTRALSATSGVTRADVSLEKQLATVVYDSGKVSEQQLRQVVERAGFTVDSGS